MSDCRGICIGAAGISNRDTAKLLTRNLKEQGMQGVIRLVGDHETALAGALEEPAGVILIAGTGSICYGINESGAKFRAGGYGHIIDDAGSAYAIGKDILKAVVRSSDGRQGQTVLKERFPQPEIIKMRGEAAQGAVRIILRETAERNGYETIPGN
ncbi:BadF/BadG/BcrA/BcrD ATPase family protein [Lacrimispora sp.]|uniref:BadF/BadG/BcrA/BcrD ATPase family protein n=1 Tax=Lacrimispora sp. TaxID=2719234 RepID=UPI00289E2B2C|nr:BadF/BadG/BcrA/BcrD ATPase family protein [Lacrimispora sp.]